MVESSFFSKIIDQSIYTVQQKQSIYNTETTVHKNSIPSVGVNVSLVEGSQHAIQIDNAGKNLFRNKNCS